MNEEFLSEISALVRKHPALYYSTELDDSHIPFHPVQPDLINGIFCNVWDEYNCALFDSVRQIVRYEKSLIAWEQLTKTAEDRIRDTLVMDYVFPTFRFVCDIPSVFKDQLIRAVVKLVCISESNFHLVELNGSGEPARLDWIGEFNKVCERNPSANELHKVVQTDLYASQDAGHFRSLHGFAIHDASSNLVSGKPVTSSIEHGVVVFAFEKPLDLGHELQIIDRHRKVIQKAYELFDRFISNIYQQL